MNKERFVRAEFAAWVGIIGNIILATMKGIVGYMSNSKALIADAVNSASDVAGSIAVLIGLKAAKLPPDKDHPYGHGKAESIAAIIVSVLLLLVGFEIATSSVKSIYEGVEAAPAWYALIAILISIVAKEVLFQYKYRLGKQISSQALIANAWDHRSDVYSSIAALVGVGGAVLGKQIGLPFLYYLDPAAGIFVAILLMRMGYLLVKESIHNTLDHVLHKEDAVELVNAVQQVKGVIAVDELRAREHGYYVIVDVKISVNPKITVAEGHEIAAHARQVLIEGFDHVSDAFIHVNPFDQQYAYKDLDSDDDSKVIH